MLRQACLIVAQVVVITTLIPQAIAIDLNRAIEGVEERYNRPKAMSLEFVQRYTWPGRPPRTESGTLYLKKPRRMRWEYQDPPGKLFLSDGKDVYFYSPLTNRVEKLPLKESGDLRTPLAFLIGRVDLRRDFREFRARQNGDDLEITALPASKKAPYAQVDFVLTPDNRIKRLQVLGHDESLMEFQFSNEARNPALDEGLFTFEMPAGAEFVDMSGDEAGD